MIEYFPVLKRFSPYNFINIRIYTYCKVMFAIASARGVFGVQPNRKVLSF